MLVILTKVIRLYIFIFYIFKYVMYVMYVKIVKQLHIHSLGLAPPPPPFLKGVSNF